MARPRTLYEKIWDAHAVADLGGGEWLLYIDRHLVYEVTSPQAFEGLRAAGRIVRRPDLTFAVADHNVPTEDRAGGLAAIRDPDSRAQVATLERNARDFGLDYAELTGDRHGIVHVVGPELGLTLPGATIVCGDSHTSTHGAFGALAFGIGTSEAEHVLATQTLVQRRSGTMAIEVEGRLGRGVTAKDLILAIIGRIGTGGATGHVIEYRGSAIRALDMAGRMTVCNMAIEAGARAGMIAPDETTFAWIEGRPSAPRGAEFDAAVAHWRTLPTDDEAVFDRTVAFDASEVAPMVTWGTSPEAVTTIAGAVPDPAAEDDDARRAQMVRMLAYMDLKPGQALSGLAIDAAFIGSCTNSRIEDLRAAAEIARGRRVAKGVRALVVPGSAAVKRDAEREGLDHVFTEAGFQWRDAGCSMCLGLNPDRLQPGERCASTSNRNFEGRQGPGGRTHLVSPAMAAAAAIAGKLVDVRDFHVTPFRQLTGIAAPLPLANVDTDMILPAAFLKTVSREGLGRGLFHNLRVDAAGEAHPDFVLNRQPWDQARILITLDNFGCGSSREHAPWALRDFGISCILAPRFADIFHGNCFKNGMLPVMLPRDEIDRLLADAADPETATLTVDLEAQHVLRSNSEAIPFEIDPQRRARLLEGVDDIAHTLGFADAIARHETTVRARAPWLANARSSTHDEFMDHSRSMLMMFRTSESEGR